MEYVQERIATLHAFDDPDPPAPVDRATVVVPLAARDHGTEAASNVFSTLATLDPERVVVALRAEAGEVTPVVSWLESFDLPVTVLWCTAPAVENLLAEYDLDGDAGKGRDVWLALGVAADSEYVVVHDADVTSYDRTYVTRLLAPLAEKTQPSLDEAQIGGDGMRRSNTDGIQFSKGYYARVEDDQLYGRLCRLFVVPLVRALAAQHGAPGHDTAQHGAARQDVAGGDAAILQYLDAFRYPLAGEFAVTGALARELRPPRGWGLEIGTLGDAFEAVGMAGTAQVDLGVYEHDHRPVDGDEGLGTMAREVAQALFTVVEDHDIDPDYDGLSEQYREVALELVEQYAADAAFNGLAYDAAAERAQVGRYGDAIAPPAGDDLLPAWSEIGLDAGAVLLRSEDALAGVRSAPQHD